MEWRSLIGLVVGIGGIFLGQLLEGGHAASLLQPAGLLIVMAGTLGAVLLQSGPQQVWQAVLLLRAGFARSVDDSEALERNIWRWSLVKRRSGALALQPLLEEVQDPFIARGLRLIVDGVPSAKVADILTRDSERFAQQQRRTIRVWEAAGGYAPTMGILGAVLGLIHAMENLSEPARLGSGIAVAFVSTLYGLGLANLLLLPVAARLKSALSVSLERRDMLADALAAIAEGEPLHIIEERLAAVAGQTFTRHKKPSQKTSEESDA